MLPRHLNGKSIDYLQWRDNHLRLNIGAQNFSPIEISPTLNQSADDKAIVKLCSQVHDFGYASYQWNAPSENIAADVQRLHTKLSLDNHDSGIVTESSGLSLLQDMTGTSQGKFIPYTARAMGWHTDGYYNAPACALRCFTLHAINQAASGGTLSLVDDRMLLIRLYDQNPDIVTLLTDAQAMTIPGNKDELGHNRPARTTAVFFNHADGTLGTHFTTRKSNIHWKTPDTRHAALCAARLIEDSPDLHHKVRLEAGQGIIARNILHRREAFTDDKSQEPRQMLRGRYLQVPNPVQHKSFKVNTHAPCQ